MVEEEHLFRCRGKHIGVGGELVTADAAVFMLVLISPEADDTAELLLTLLIPWFICADIEVNSVEEDARVFTPPEISLIIPGLFYKYVEPRSKLSDLIPWCDRKTQRKISIPSAISFNPATAIFIDLDT